MHWRRGDVHAENIGTYSLCDIIMYMYDLTYCDIWTVTTDRQEMQGCLSIVWSSCGIYFLCRDSQDSRACAFQWLQKWYAS